MSVMRAVGTIVCIYGAYKLGKAVGATQQEMRHQIEKYKDAEKEARGRG